VVLESSPVPEIKTLKQLTGQPLADPQTKRLCSSRRREAERPGRRIATVPSPEGQLVARTKRSPGFGLPFAFPVSQWRVNGIFCPLQWRGRAGVTPASEHPGSRYSKARYPRLDQESNGKPSRRKVSVPSAAFGETTERNCFCGLGIKLPCCALPRISNKTTKLFLSCSRCLRVSPPILVVPGQQAQPEGSPAA
jgi:hypothetical protein